MQECKNICIDKSSAYQKIMILIHKGLQKHLIKIDIICSVQNTRVKEILEKLPFERFLQAFEISHTFLSPVSHGEKRGKFKNHVKVTHKAIFQIFLFH